MKREKVLELGFEELPHKALGKPLIYNLGRNRQLSLSNLGNPNEVLFIYETDIENPQDINDMVCLHNYDYDGYLTEEKLSLLLTFFAQKQ